MQPRVGWLSSHTSTRNLFVYNVTVLSMLILWMSLTIDVGLITERKWKILAAAIMHHTRAVGVVLVTWTVHHLV